MKFNRTSIVVVCTSFIILLALFVSSPSSNAQIGGTTVVKLYSGDKLVASWEKAAPGHAEGNTYVFRYGVFEREVRINGTYSVEVVK